MPGSLCVIACPGKDSSGVSDAMLMHETAEVPSLPSLLWACWVSWQPISLKENLLEGERTQTPCQVLGKEASCLCGVSIFPRLEIGGKGGSEN